MEIYCEEKSRLELTFLSRFACFILSEIYTYNTYYDSQIGHDAWGAFQQSNYHSGIIRVFTLRLDKSWRWMVADRRSIKIESLVLENTFLFACWLVSMAIKFYYIFKSFFSLCLTWTIKISFTWNGNGTGTNFDK